MISKIDRRRIYIFMGIAFAISIATAMVLFFAGGLYLRYPDVVNPLSKFFTMWSMLAPAIANILARGITREGWTNTLLRPNLRRGWPLYLAALFLPALAILGGAAIYYLLFPRRFDPSMTYAREERAMIAIRGGYRSIALYHHPDGLCHRAVPA